MFYIKTPNSLQLQLAATRTQMEVEARGNAHMLGHQAENELEYLREQVGMLPPPPLPPLPSPFPSLSLF